mgnify:CR=1 FL=1
MKKTPEVVVAAVFKRGRDQQQDSNSKLYCSRGVHREGERKREREGESVCACVFSIVT